MLTLNVVLGYQGLLFWDFLFICFYFFIIIIFFNQTDQPNIRKRIRL